MPHLLATSSSCTMLATDRRGGDIGRGPSPDLEQLMHVLVQRAKLLLSLRGVVLAQKVRTLSLTLTLHPTPYT